MSALYLRQLQLGPMENFVYLLGAPGGEACVVVDPAWDVPAILAAAAEDGRRITHAFVSHSHGDHINGLAPLLEKLDLPVLAQGAEIDFSPALKRLGKAVKRVGPGEVIDAAGLGISCIHTPGHTPGSQCLHVQDALVTGDTLFIGACGRCDLAGGSAEQMFESLHRLSALDEATQVYAGHDYGEVPVATIGEQKRVNPYLALAQREAFVAYRNRPRH